MTISPEIKDVLGLSAVGLSSANLSLYIASIFRKNIKPHAFSWIIWSTVMISVFFAQHFNGGGAGAWQTLTGGILCGVIGIIALFRGKRDITRGDYVALAASLGALPVWACTHDALYAVILLSAIDTIGYYPTFRKSYLAPHEENLRWAFQGSLVFIFSLSALENYTWTTALYPVVMIIVNMALGFMLIWRRRAMP